MAVKTFQAFAVAVDQMKTWQTIIQQLRYICQMMNGLTSHIESLESTMLNIPRSFAYSKVVSLGKDTTMTWAWQTTTLQYEF